MVLINFDSPSKLTAPLGVVACDAGAANVIAAWHDQFSSPLYLCAEGPARAIFRQTWPSTPFAEIESVIEQASMVLTGTGWSSDLEHRARRSARLAGIPVLALIDHWVNYQERFIWHGEEILPDVVLVTDKYAAVKATDCFKNTPVMQWSNDYLFREVELVKVLRSQVSGGAQSCHNILMVMEPARVVWPGDSDAGEFVAANYFMNYLQKTSAFAEPTTVRVRLHPSEAPGKYDQLMAQYSLLNVVMSQGISLACDIAWADLVVGCNSFALVVALSAGIPTMSILPPHAPPCVLPHCALKHLKSRIE